MSVSQPITAAPFKEENHPPLPNLSPLRQVAKNLIPLEEKEAASVPEYEWSWSTYVLFHPTEEDPTEFIRAARSAGLGIAAVVILNDGPDDASALQAKLNSMGFSTTDLNGSDYMKRKGEPVREGLRQYIAEIEGDLEDDSHGERISEATRASLLSSLRKTPWSKYYQPEEARAS